MKSLIITSIILFAFLNNGYSATVIASKKDLFDGLATTNPIDDADRLSISNAAGKSCNMTELMESGFYDYEEDSTKSLADCIAKLKEHGCVVKANDPPPAAPPTTIVNPPAVTIINDACENPFDPDKDNALLNFQDVVDALDEGSILSVEKTLISLAKCFGHVSSTSQAKKMNRDERTDFLATVSAIDDNQLDQLITVMNYSPTNYKKVCNFIKSDVDLDVPGDIFTSIDDALETVSNTDNDGDGDDDDDDDLKITSDSTSEKPSVFEQLIGAVRQRIQTMAVESQRAQEERRVRAEREAAIFRARQVANSQATLQMDNIRLACGLVDPRMASEASVNNIAQCQNEMTGHMNSFIKQKNDAETELASLKNELKVKTEEALALEQNTKNAFLKTVAVAKKEMETAKRKYEEFKEDLSSNDSDLRKEAKLAKVDYETKLAEHEDAQAKLDAGVWKQLNQSIRAAAQLRIKDLQGEILLKEQTIAQADEKVAVTKDHIFRARMTIVGKQAKVAHEMRMEKANKEAQQSALQRSPGSGNNLIPVQRSVYTRRR